MVLGRNLKVLRKGGASFTIEKADYDKNTQRYFCDFNYIMTVEDQSIPLKLVSNQLFEGKELNIYFQLNSSTIIRHVRVTLFFKNNSYIFRD
jgi:hypothetical protein